MAVLNDEVPDDDDFDVGRKRGEFDHITPDDVVNDGNPPGWLSEAELSQMRAKVPMPYVMVVPVRTDDQGAVTQVGTLLAASDDGSVNRTIVAGRVLYHETIREAIARSVAHDLGDLALPVIPPSVVPFMVAEFFPTPGVSDYYDPRQHAIALCYVIDMAGDCKPQDETLDIEWAEPNRVLRPDFCEQVPNGCGKIIRAGLVWAGAI